MVPWLLLGLLFVAYIFAIIDRFLLALLAEPIKADLGISDTEIGLLFGLAFLVLNSLLQLPIARAVDRRRRLPIIAIGIAVWSVMTMASGLATRFLHLALARVFVGAGEAALIPGSHALIGDSFPPRRLGLALGIFYLGGNMAVGLALMIGGTIVGWASRLPAESLPLLGGLAPWQITFVAVGLPGLLLAAGMACLPEPPRGTRHGEGASWADVSRYARANAGWVVPAFLAAACANLTLSSSLTWVVPLLGRRFGWSIEEAGIATGAAACLGSLTGLLAGGWLSDLVSQAGSYRRLQLCAALLAAGALAGAVFPELGTPFAMIVGCTLVLLLCGPAIAGTGANLQDGLPSDMRGLGGGVFTIVINLLGAATGPFLVAAISDAHFGGGAGIRHAMAIVQAAAALAGAALFSIAARNQRLMGGAVRREPVTP